MAHHLKNALFSEDGKYFVFYHTDGKLKIWDTVSGKLKQEYTPNEHLTLPCSALGWLSLPHLLSTSPGKKKKRRGEEEEGATSSYVILLGLKSGSVLLYSLSTGGVQGELQGLGSAVNCISWAKKNDVFVGCANGSIVHWELPTKQITSKWRGSRSPISSIVAHKNLLITATQTITVWDRQTHLELKTFLGHASPVSRLFVSGSNYIVSVAHGDRHINVWPLADESKNELIASFVLPDQPVHVDVGGSEEKGLTRLAVITEGGVLHSFSHLINGSRHPPVKPHLTVQIASSESSNNPVDSIPILGALVSRSDASFVHIAHGNSVVLRFEKLNVAISKEVLWLVRQSSTRLEPAATSSKVRNTEDKVKYVTAAGVKRPRDAGSAKQLPIEQRINNLSLTTVSKKSAMPCSDSLAQLLTQGLQSSDQKLLRKIVLNKDNKALTSTVSRLPPAAVPMLLRELAVLVHWRGWRGEAAAKWIHALLVHHSALVLSSPDLPQVLGPMLGLVEARLAQVASLARLRGRLSLLLGQVAHSHTAKSTPQEASVPEDELQAPLLQYRDGEESSSDEFGLDSDEEETQEDAVNGEVSSDEDKQPSDDEMDL